MERFEQEALLDRVAAAGRLDARLAERLADDIAAFHRQAEHRPDHGGEKAMRWVIEGNVAGLAEYGHGIIEPSLCRALAEGSFREVDRQADRLERRRASGFVRQCHGDLHLGNIVLLDGRPTLFDAVEFNDELSCIDVFYDLSFLLMDLWRRQLHPQANLILNRYVAATADVEGLALLPLFLSCRAAVRAKTSVTALRSQGDGPQRAELQASAHEYLALSLQCLSAEPAMLVAIGGFSGSGKSTLAAALAPELGGVPGAIVLRSDVTRKRLAGVEPLIRLRSEDYLPAMSRQVYDILAREAAEVLRAGHTAVVDAVFARPEDRRALERVAAEAGVGFAGFWLEVPEATLVQRIEGRREDASDADRTVVRNQIAQGAGLVEWGRLDASGTLAEVSAHVRAHLATVRTAP